MKSDSCRLDASSFPSIQTGSLAGELARTRAGKSVSIKQLFKLVKDGNRVYKRLARPVDILNLYIE